KIRFLSPIFWLSSRACLANSSASLNWPLTFSCSLHFLINSSSCVARSEAGGGCVWAGAGELFGGGVGCCARVSALPESRKTLVHKRKATQFFERTFMSHGRVLYGLRILNLYSASRDAGDGSWVESLIR